jgi:hypothetical protein
MYEIIIWKYVYSFEIDLSGIVDSMIGPHERKVFWDIAEDIAREDIKYGRDNRTLAGVYRRFFRIKPKTD